MIVIHEYIKHLLENESPKITTLSKEDRAIYEFGHRVLGSCFVGDFFDIPKLPKDRFSADGLFYTLEYYDAEILATVGNKVTLLVVWKVENNSSFCPINIEFEFEDEENFRLILRDHEGRNNSTVKWDIVNVKDGKYYTEVKGFALMKLSELVGYTQRKLAAFGEKKKTVEEDIYRE